MEEDGEYSPAPKPEYSSLAARIIKTFETNKDARSDSGIEDEIFDSLRDYNGQYSPNDLAKIVMEGGSEIFMNLTATKSRAAMSWIRDILLNPNEDPFTVVPTPIPSLPEDLEKKLEEAFNNEFIAKSQQQMQQGPVAPNAAQDTVLSLQRDKRDVRDAVLEELNLEALDQMKVIERKIKDDLKEGKWEQALSDFIEDFCIFPAAFMKGPVISKKERLTWVNGQPTVVEDYIFANKRVSPMDVYPSPSATCIQEGDFVEHMRLSASELYSLKGTPAYKDDAISKVLESDESGSCWLNTGIEDERAEEEQRGSSDDADIGMYHALHYWGTAKTEELVEWGLIEDVDDEDKRWEIEAILVGTEVIKCKLNDDPLKRRPYYKASYQNIPGSFWGRSLPNLMRDIQRMCNACARALANNMGLAAGPQITLVIDRLADSGDVEDIKPLKIWQVTSDPTGSNGRAVDFFQVPSIANELLAVYDKFEQKADDATGIPRYSYGNEKVGGAAQTASGLSMLLESATKSIKDAIRHIDSGLIIPRVEYQFYWNLLNNSINYTGDINVIAHGSSTLTLKGAQQAKRQEFLQITANQADQELMGPEGRAELIRILAKDLGITNDIVPSRLELRKKLEEIKQQQAQMAEMKNQETQSKANAMLQSTQMRVEAEKEISTKDQLIRIRELDQQRVKDIEKTQLEQERIASTREATQMRAMNASQSDQTKKEVARTQAAVALTKGQ